MKVGFGSTDWSGSVFDENGHPVMGGAGWARLGQYKDLLPYVSDIGILVHKDGLFGVKDWEGEMHFDHDVVVMQRAMFEDIPEKIKLAQANGQIIVNDLDDWYWGLSTTNGAFAASHPKLNPGENTNHYKRVLAASDYVTVSTPYLAERISSWVRCPITIIPNFVDVSKFTPRVQSDTDVPIVGWVGSTGHRSGDLEVLAGLLFPLVQSGKIQLHHSGDVESHPKFADSVKVPSDLVSTLPMASPQNYPSLFQFDIGLVPLSDKPFNQAKSAIKGLEYAAAGVPFIASSTDEYRSLHESGIGFIAKKPKSWIGLIEKLRDPQYRKEQAEIVRKEVSNYDISCGVKVMNDFYLSIT
jgi:glycosyltransferase involved in cell wall biosynthesis